MPCSPLDAHCQCAARSGCEKDRRDSGTVGSVKHQAAGRSPACPAPILPWKNGSASKYFAHMGMIAEQLPPALARHHNTISSKLRQGNSKYGQTRLLRPDCWSPGQKKTGKAAPHPPTPQAARQVQPGQRPLARAYPYSPAATACCRQNPLWGLEADLVCAAGGQAAAQLQGAQEPLSAAGQGPTKQDGCRLGRGVCSGFV